MYFLFVLQAPSILWITSICFFSLSFRQDLPLLYIFISGLNLEDFYNFRLEFANRHFLFCIKCSCGVKSFTKRLFAWYLSRSFFLTAASFSGLFLRRSRYRRCLSADVRAFFETLIRHSPEINYFVIITY